MVPYLRQLGSRQVRNLLVQKYVLYWYKSTNTNTWGAVGQEDLSLIRQLQVQKYKYWRIYWYESTNTDTLVWAADAIGEEEDLC